MGRRELASVYHRLWTEALALPGLSLEDSTAVEAAEWFRIPREEAERRLAGGRDALAERWCALAPDPGSAAAVEAFYDAQDEEAFELLDYHRRASPRSARGPLKYAFALDVARAAGARRVLDIGSGVGSGAILFARHGLEPTLADISGRLLALARWRLERRGLAGRCRFVDRRAEDVEDAGFDLVTCFDVLEHAVDPRALVAWARRKLGPGGLALLYPDFGKDPLRPMHVARAPRLDRCFRGMGFAFDRPLCRRALELHLRKMLVLRRVERSVAGSALVGVWDAMVPQWANHLRFRVGVPRVRLPSDA